MVVVGWLWRPHRIDRGTADAYRKKLAKGFLKFKWLEISGQMLELARDRREESAQIAVRGVTARAECVPAVSAGFLNESDWDSRDTF